MKILSALALSLVILSAFLLGIYHKVESNSNGVGTVKEDKSNHLIQENEKKEKRIDKEETPKGFTGTEEFKGFSQGTKGNSIKNNKPSRIQKSKVRDIGQSEKPIMSNIALEPALPAKIFTEDEKRLIEREFIRMLTGEISGDSWK